MEEEPEQGTLGSYELCWGGDDKDAPAWKKGIGRIIGWIPLIGSLGIAIGYSIIIGWVLRSLGGSLTGTILSTDSAEYFSQATGSFGSLPWHLAVVLITVAILLTGSVAQIEKANRIMMPVFFILFAALAVRVGFLDGAEGGYSFLFVPKWEQLKNVDTWVMAMGQAFFSLSITGSGMIVYGSYLNKNADIIGASMRTAVFDTIAALLSALAIMRCSVRLRHRAWFRSGLNVYHNSKDFFPDAHGTGFFSDFLPVCRVRWNYVPD